MAKRAYRENIIGLTNTVHHFEFEVGNDFFSHYGTQLITEGALKAEVTLDKRETLIEVTFFISGTVKLICDRSLDPFDALIQTKKALVFKYGETDEELSDEIIMIQRDTEALDFGQYIYEFIALQVPMKKLHPRFRAAEEAEDEAVEGKIVYSSKLSHDDTVDEGTDIDPRWEILRKLK